MNNRLRTATATLSHWLTRVVDYLFDIDLKPEELDYLEGRRTNARLPTGEISGSAGAHPPGQPHVQRPRQP